NSGKVLEVPGGNTNNNVILDQNTYTGALCQQWDVNPIPSTWGGDYSYFTLKAAHDGVTADNLGFSYSNGNQIGQWNGGTNAVEQWYFQYVTNNYFKIRSRWSNKVLGVNGASTANGAVIVQWDDTGTLDQQWRLIPAAVSTYDFVAPAAPLNVSATANAVSVQLNWKTNSESDFASYTVLRATNSAGPYEICARGLTTNAFTDKAANLNKTYFYVVRAVDASLNTSANSAMVSARPSDAPAIVARYTFDGVTDDSSGNANHPIVIYGAPGFAAGKFGSALGFNGTNQYVMLPAGMLAGSTNFTIAAWVYWNGGSAWQRIFDFGNDTTQYLFLTPNSGGGTLRFAITTNGLGAEQVVETASLPSNQWVHVAVTCNGTTGSLYTNGVLAATASVLLSPSSFNPALNYLGQSQFAGDPSFAGRIDNFLVANYAMTASQIAWLPINSAPLPALVHRYSFSEIGGTNVSDSVGGAAWNGTLPNGGALAGGQLALSAASAQYVQLPPGILSNYSAVTIEAWATFPNQIPWNTMFFAFGTTNGSDGNDYIFCAPQGGRIAITSTNWTGEQNAYSGMDFSYRTNLHIAAVFSPATKYLGIYTNGILAGVNTAVTTPMTAVSNVFSYIGRSLYSGDAYFNVSLDELRIYSGVLQPADIAAAQLVGPNVPLTTNVSLSSIENVSGLTLTWAAAGAGLTLASSPVLGPAAVWTPVPLAATVIGTNYQVNISPTNASLYFRLQR
ncbi:MAG TPA: LamG-like jellyroll fold domain-containing protein, partial [Verrucomicrobiae bacterium]